MQLILNLQSGRKITVDYQPNDLVENLVQKAAEVSIIDVTQINLIYEGRRLDVKSTIDSCNLRENSNIQVMNVVEAGN